MGENDTSRTVTDPFRLFAAHGFMLQGHTDTQVYGRCPFSGKDQKLYINKKTLAWDSKVAQLSGGPLQFLEYAAAMYAKAMPEQQLKWLAIDRQLPESVFRPWGIGWTGYQYSIPVKDFNGRVQDIRLYRRKGKCMSTPGAKVGLLGAHLLRETPSYPVYICEGEWDGMSLHWLLKKLGIAGVVVAVPGALTFKPEWATWLTQRTVYLCYDNDGPGEDGQRLAASKLMGVAKRVQYLHWPAETPEKFDVRDWITRVAVKTQRPRECWEGLSRMFKSEPRPFTHGQAKQQPTPEPEKPRPTAYTQPPALAEVFRVFKKWLFLENTDAIEIMLSVVMSNQIEGDPIWMFLVSPPGGAKTETLTSLSECEQIFMVSSLTPHSLISGASFSGGGDPSLIPKLNGRVLVIKDFTSILSKRDQEKDEIFGILRDAYDGRCSKVFGTGITRSYMSRFSVLAAVTPAIYGVSEHHQSLGERFLKFLVGDNLVHHSEEDIILRSIKNINHETQMRAELSDVVSAIVKTSIPTTLPVIPDEYQRRIVALAQFGARMRGVVPRDQYRPEIVNSRPMAEVGSRLGKQLAKLAVSIAALNHHPIVGEHEYRLVKKTMLDTIPQRNEDVVQTIYQRTPGEDDTLKTKDVAVYSRYPLATVGRLLADMYILGIVERIGTAAAHRWRMSRYILDAIAGAGIYQQEEANGGLQNSRNGVGSLRGVPAEGGDSRTPEHGRGGVRIAPGVGSVQELPSV